MVYSLRNTTVLHQSRAGMRISSRLHSHTDHVMLEHAAGDGRPVWLAFIFPNGSCMQKQYSNLPNSSVISIFPPSHRGQNLIDSGHYSSTPSTSRAVNDAAALRIRSTACPPVLRPPLHYSCSYLHNQKRFTMAFSRPFISRFISTKVHGMTPGRGTVFAPWESCESCV